MKTYTTTILQDPRKFHTWNGANVTVKQNDDATPEFTKLSKEEKTEKYFGGLVEFRTKVVWLNALVFLILHLMGLYGVGIILWHFLHLRFSLLAYNLVVIGICNAGVTAGAHRLFTHRAYKARFPLKVLLLFCFTLTGQNSLYEWVRDHRQHHKYTDTDADPHNAKRGFFFSHIGWLMMRKHPEVIKKGKGIDMSDMESDPLVMFQKRYVIPLFLVLHGITVVLPHYMNDIPLSDSFFVSVFRFVLILNGTWAVNSFAHLNGTKPFDKNIMPVENKYVSMLTNGEGWHNYHHSFPWDYKASEYGASHNLTTSFINFCAKIGQAYDLKMATDEMVRKTAFRYGDGSYKMKSEHKKEPVRGDTMRSG